VLDLVAFDEAPFAAKLAGAEAAGLRFVSLAELGDTDEVRCKLHALNEKTVLDIPGYEDRASRPYEVFAKQVFDASWFRAEGQIVALDGEMWIGLAAVGIFPETHSAYNMFTGVAPAWRGRGIAQALKLLGIRFARRDGATHIRTNNDSENAPMLAINHTLGYQPEPGCYIMERA
ncbi:MAG TPA: GNAT family N-acetyltransferase, partial [Ktedonobacterales bacterium]|nr:GNAT family N-acetyltransferase [Ktedonobacterales bacterium]